MPNISKKTKLLVLLMVAIKIWMGSHNIVIAHPNASLNTENFNSLAEQIINGLDASPINDFTFRSGYDRPGIEISSFSKHKMQGDQFLSDLANEFNSGLLAALIRKTEGRFKFFSQSAQQSKRGPKLFCKMGEHCGFAGNSSIRSSEADILIIGSMRISGRYAFLSYKAISIDNGLILAATSTVQSELSTNLLKRRHGQREIRLSEHKSTIVSDRTDFTCPDLKSLKRALVDLGYYSENFNDKNGPATQMAIKAYQWHHNFPETGKYSCELAKHVRSEIKARGLD